MRGWNGVLFEVDWAGVPESNANFDPPTPFRSGVGGPEGPYDLGWIGEIPKHYSPRSRHSTVPARVCTNCFLGPVSYWSTGWPAGAPGVLLAPDGWPVSCSPNNPAFWADACSAACGSAVESASAGPYAGAGCSAACGTGAESIGYPGYGCDATCAVGAELLEGFWFGHGCSAACATGAELLEGFWFGHGCSAACATGAELLEGFWFGHGCDAACATAAELLGVSYAGSGCNAACATGVEETVTVPFTFGCGDVAATGSVQGDAAPLIYDTNRVTGANGTKGVILPSGCYRIVMSNTTASGVKVYPPSGEQIGTLGANNPQTVSISTVLYIRIAGLSPVRWVAVNLT